MSLPTLQSHPNVPRNLPLIQGIASKTGILQVSSLEAPSIELHYCITTHDVLLAFHQYRLENGYNIFYFTPFSSEEAWLRLNLKRAIANTISPQNTETAPSNITSYSSTAITSSPLTHPNLTSTSPVDQTTALINLMTQKFNKMRQWQRSSSAKPPRNPLKHQFPKPSRSSVPPLINGMRLQPPSRYYWRKLKITSPMPIAPVSSTGHKRLQRHH